MVLQSWLEGIEQLWHAITNPSWKNSISLLLGTSLVVWVLESWRPWRKGATFRRDFFLDAFYMVFNFILAPVVVLNVLYAGVHHLFQNGIGSVPAFNIGSWPPLAQIVLLFLVQDFTHYWIHRLLHRVPWLWNFHRVHHSVKEMGFAAHLRYHWMENVIYRGLSFLPLSIFHANPGDLTPLYLFTLLVGHLNHANLRWNYGPLRWILNHPTMHLWHHMKKLAEGRPHGVNFGISLSLWDHLFGTALRETPPHDLELGFEGDEHFPKGFVGQNLNLRGPKAG